MSKTFWKMQMNGDWEVVNRCGCALSLKIDCAVHYPAYGKRMFECEHNQTFPIYVVQGALDSDDWTEILKTHPPATVG